MTTNILRLNLKGPEPVDVLCIDVGEAVK